MCVYDGTWGKAECRASVTSSLSADISPNAVKSTGGSALMAGGERGV